MRYITLIVTAALMAGCAGQKFEGYEESGTGLYYKFHVKSGDTLKPRPGDYVFITMINKFGEDSILYNSWQRKQDGIVSFNLRQPAFHGSFEEGIMMMSPGDSASFRISADSIYALIPKEDSAEAFPPGTYFTFEIRLVKVMTALEMQEEQRKKYEAYMDQVNQKSEWNKANGQKLIEDYLTQNKINAKPTRTGLVYIEHEKGSGAWAKPGRKVTVAYVGRILEDGTVFQSSEYEFTLGKGEAIPGWDEGIALMRKGGKATLLIPSSLGYDDRGAVDPQSGMYTILPYAPLLFEVELLDVK